MSSIDQKIGLRLRARRRLLGLTQDQVAVQVGVRFQQIQKYETGHNQLSVTRLVMLSHALEMPIAELCAGLGEEGGADELRQESAAA